LKSPFLEIITYESNCKIERIFFEPETLATHKNMKRQPRSPLKSDELKNPKIMVGSKIQRVRKNWTEGVV